MQSNGIVQIVEAVKIIKPCRKASHIHSGASVLCILYYYLGSGLLHTTIDQTFFFLIIFSFGFQYLVSIYIN
jgi:hypothetical protein